MTHHPLAAELAAIDALARSGASADARAAIIALAAAHPADPQIQYAAACIHDLLGFERAAIPFYHAAIEGGLSPTDLPSAYLGLGSTYRALGMYAEAFETLERGCAAFPEYPALRVFRAMAAYNHGQPRAAVSDLLLLLAETSSDAEIQAYGRAIRFYAEDLDRTWEA